LKTPAPSRPPAEKPAEMFILHAPMELGIAGLYKRVPPPEGWGFEPFYARAPTPGKTTPMYCYYSRPDSEYLISEVAGMRTAGARAGQYLATRVPAEGPRCDGEGQWFLVQDHVTVPAAFTGLNARAVALPGDAHRDDFVDFDFPPSMEWSRARWKPPDEAIPGRDAFDAALSCLLFVDYDFLFRRPVDDRPAQAADALTRAAETGWSGAPTFCKFSDGEEVLIDVFVPPPAGEASDERRCGYLQLLQKALVKTERFTGERTQWVSQFVPLRVRWIRRRPFRGVVSPRSAAAKSTLWSPWAITGSEGMMGGVSKNKDEWWEWIRGVLEHPIVGAQAKVLVAFVSHAGMRIVIQDQKHRYVTTDEPLHFRSDGLAEGSSAGYVILRVATVFLGAGDTDAVELVLLGCAFGAIWNGAWSPGSAEWTKVPYAQRGPLEMRASPSRFWMSREDFEAHFFLVDEGHLPAGAAVRAQQREAPGWQADARAQARRGIAQAAASMRTGGAGCADAARSGAGRLVPFCATWCTPAIDA